MKKILVNVIHPNLEESTVNKRLLKTIEPLPNITVNNLYEKYPDFNIDVAKEKALLVEHDVIVFQFPMYWFSSPALLKEWFDVVLEAGFAYGGNYALKDKTFAVAVSCGAQEKEFSHTGKEKQTVNEFLFPFYGTANYIKMNYAHPFIVYGAEEGLKEEQLHAYMKEYLTYIQAFH
jgi:putative NADPH-quinone reductase